MDNLLDHLSETVTRARTVEELTRPLLELLEDITGFESTYLTVVDLEGRGLLEVVLVLGRPSGQLRRRDR